METNVVAIANVVTWSCVLPLILTPFVAAILEESETVVHCSCQLALELKHWITNRRDSLELLHVGVLFHLAHM